MIVAKSCLAEIDIDSRWKNDDQVVVAKVKKDDNTSSVIENSKHALARHRSDISVRTI